MTLKAFTWPGSWPNELKEQLGDEELIALSDDQLRAMIAAAYREQWTLTGGDIQYLCHGDPGHWKDWIRIPGSIVARRKLGLRERPMRKYQHLIRVPQSAKKITPDMLGTLGYPRVAKIAYEEFKKFRDEVKKPDLKLRLGMALGYDWALMINTYAWNTSGIRQVLVRDIKQILEFVDIDDVLFSFESPFGQIITGIARRLGLGKKVTQQFARMFREMLDQLPPNIRIALHPCWGDFKKESMITGLMVWALFFLPKRWVRRWALWFQTADAIVDFVEPMQQVAGSRLEEVMLCVGAGTGLPSDNPRDYWPFRHLSRLEGVIYALGICHENLTDHQAELVHDAAIDGSQLPGDVLCPTCGLGRMPEHKARRIIFLAKHLRQRLDRRRSIQG